MRQDAQVFLNCRRQRAVQEFPGDHFFVVPVGVDSIQIVFVNKLFEHVAADDERAWRLDGYAFVSVAKQRLGDHGVDEGDPPGFAAERSVAQFDEGVLHVFFGQAGEIQHHAGLIFPEVGVQHVQDIGADVLHAPAVRRIDKPQLVGHLELGPGPEPAGKMIIDRVVVQTLVRQIPDDTFQSGDVAGFGDDPPIGVLEHKRAESVVFQNKCAQVMQQLRRVLVQKMHLQGAGLFLMHRFLRLQQQRKIGVHRPHLPNQLEPRRRVHLASAGIAHVGNDAEQVVPVGVDQGHRFFVGFRQQDFRPQPDPQQTVPDVHGVQQQIPGLGQYLRIQKRQDPRIVDRRVLDQQDGLHPLFAVRRHIHLVFDVFDNRQQNAAVAGPVKNAVNTGLAPDVGDHVRCQPVIGKHHDRQFGIRFFDGLLEFKRFHVADPGHRDHQVDRIRRQDGQRILLAGRLVNPWDIGNTEVGELMVDLLGQLAVLLQDKAVIDRGNQQDLGHTILDQFMDAGKPGFQVGKLFHNHLFSTFRRNRKFTVTTEYSDD